MKYVEYRESIEKVGAGYHVDVYYSFNGKHFDAFQPVKTATQAQAKLREFRAEFKKELKNV
jgi:hypothetical protein